jgi:uncharacterized lipoprotein YmbA
MKPRHRDLAILVGLPFVLNSGCAFLKPRADPTMFYVLTASASPPPTSAPSRTIGLGPIRLSEYLDRTQLVTRVAANQLRISEVDRWGEPLGAALGNTLQQDLAAVMGGDAVVLHPWNPSVHPLVTIAIDVLRFERVSDRAVEVVARWAIHDDNGQLQLANESHINQPTTAVDAQAAVAALSQATSTLARELAEALGRLGALKSSARAQPFVERH